MPKAILTRGLQGSGKSTFAKNYCIENPNWVVVSRDALRHMRGKYWMPKHEDLISAWEDNLIVEAVKRGYSVIIDEMHLNPQILEKHKVGLKLLGVTEIEVKDFTDVPLEVCIERDKQRPFSIGERVLRETYDRYLRKKPEFYLQSPELPHAIIVDLDGTLCLFGKKNPYERDFINDKLNEAVAQIIRTYLAGSYEPGKLIIFSGRSERFKTETEQWFRNHEITPDIFEMRTAEEEKAQVKDVVVKQRMFDTFVKDKYYIDFVIDDRDQVVQLWRDLGLTCFQCDYGDF